MPLQFASELGKVIDFAVENYPNGFFLVRHGLMTAPKVDDRESAKTESEWSGDVVPLVIRASVDEGPGHSFDVPSPYRLQASEIILSTNAAHGISLICSLRLQGSIGALSVTIKPATKQIKRDGGAFGRRLLHKVCRSIRSIVCCIKIIDPFKFHDGCENGLELGHLFLAMEGHQFPGYWAWNPGEKSPTIAGS